MKFILGKKIEMTQVWRGEQVVAVTKIQTGSCVVVQVKNDSKDGYEAVQIGWGEKKEKNIAKPQKGHMKGLGNFRYLKEFRLKKEENTFKKGDIFDISSFVEGDKIKVTGTSKGKGFQGVVKRHGFAGQTKTHGTKDQVRMPGSIGATGPAHVFKGTRMGGRMGGDQVTMPTSEVVEVDTENKVLYIKGGVPGARNSLIMISGKGELTILEETKVKKSEEKVDNKKENVKEEKIEEKKEKK